MNKIIITILVSLFILSISGCGARPTEIKTTSKVNDVKFQFTPVLNSLTGKKVNFDEFDFSNDIEEMSNYSKFINIFKKARVDGNEVHHSGIKVVKANNSYLIKYQRGVNIRGTNTWYITEVIFTINYTVQNNNIIFSLSPKYEYKQDSNAIGIPIKALTSFDKLEKDAKTILSRMYKITRAKIYKRFTFSFTLNSSNAENIVKKNLWNDYKYGAMVGHTKNGNELISDVISNYKTIQGFTDSHFYVYKTKIDYKFVKNSNNKTIMKCIGGFEYSINSNGKVSRNTKDIYSVVNAIQKIINRNSDKFYGKAADIYNTGELYH